MNKYLIATNNKTIPFKKILKEVSPKNLFFLCPEMLFTSDEKLRLTKEGAKICEMKNYLHDGLIEKICCDIHKEFAFDKLIANTEKDLLWAAKVRDLLDIKGQRYSNALTFKDKFIMKCVAQQHGIKIPNFAKIESATDLIRFSKTEYFPFIVKPCRETASARIWLVKNEEDLESFIRQNLNINHESNWIAETYIKGEMYQVDGIIRNSIVELTWPSKSIHNWLDITNGKVVGKHFLAAHNPLLQKFNEYTTRIVSKFHMEENTIFHLEFFLEENTNDLVFCEIACRVGGLKGRDIWMDSFDIDLGAEFIRTQAGLPLSFPSAKNKLPRFVNGYLLFPIKKGHLKKFPERCNISGVKTYKRLIEAGREFQSSQNLLQLSCIITLTAESEEDFSCKAKKLTDWYESEFVWYN